MIYSTNWIERFNKSAKRILKTKGSLPSSDAVIFLMANLAQNIKAYPYKVANFKNIF